MTDRIVSYREAINEALRDEMARDETVLLMGEDLVGGSSHDADAPEIDIWGGVLGVTKGLVQEFGRERIRDTPLSEMGYIGAGVGAAATGLRPVVELMFIDFLGTCLDQLVNQASKMRYMFGGKASVPLVVRTMIGAGIGAAAQHSDSPYSTFVHYPGLKVVAPATPADAKGLLIAAIRDNDPVIFCEHKAMYDSKGPVPEGDYVIPLGQAEVKRVGNDVTIVAISKMVHVALKAAEQLADNGVEAEVIDLRSLAPLDEDTVLESVKKTGRLVVVDEDNPRCSVATDVVTLAAIQALEYMDAIRVVTPPNTPVPFSPPLEAYYIPTPARVVDTVMETMV